MDALLMIKGLGVAPTLESHLSLLRKCMESSVW